MHCWLTAYNSLTWKSRKMKTDRKGEGKGKCHMQRLCRTSIFFPSSATSYWLWCMCPYANVRLLVQVAYVCGVLASELRWPCLAASSDDILISRRIELLRICIICIIRREKEPTTIDQDREEDETRTGILADR